MYLHPWAGFAIRLTYWLCMMVVVGSEVVAASIYCKLWFPSVPPWVWIGLFSLAILYVNTINIAPGISLTPAVRRSSAKTLIRSIA